MLRFCIAMLPSVFASVSTCTPPGRCGRLVSDDGHMWQPATMPCAPRSCQAEQRVLELEAERLQHDVLREQELTTVVMDIIEPTREAMAQVQRDIVGVTTGLSKCCLMSQEATDVAVTIALERSALQHKLPDSCNQVR
jgi:hypothetical protein